MKRYHTVIVGGGPGGLACAAVLAGQGKDVLVLERNALVGPKVCAGGLPASTSTLALGLPESLLERSFFRQQIQTPWQGVELRAPEPIVSTIDRARLGRWMRERAEAAGAEIRAGSLVVGIGEDSLATRDRAYAYDFLVGADGSGSMVRRFLGIPAEKVGVGIHHQVIGDFPEMEWHLNPELFGKGYAWIFPHQGRASIGVYAHRKASRPAALLASLHRWAARRGLELSSQQPQAALINFDYRGWRFGRRFLVGDAAGLASGLTGEGISPAIVSGEEAARCILDPRYQSDRMTRILRQHHRHCRLLELIPEGGLGCRLSLEALAFSLRIGLIKAHQLSLEP